MNGAAGTNISAHPFPMPPSELAAVIFDVDGTLVDSVDLHARAWQETLREFGHSVSFHAIRAQIGKGGDQLLPVFLSQEEIDRDGEEITARRSRLFQASYMDQVRGFPFVRELFQRLLADGRKVALASSAKGEELTTYKQRADIADLVDTETSQDDARHSKPEPDIFEAALKRLGRPDPSTVLVVGDTPYDIEAAAKAGMRTIALRCGGFPEQTLSGAVAIYDSPAHLLTQYDLSPLAGRGSAAQFQKLANAGA